MKRLFSSLLFLFVFVCTFAHERAALVALCDATDGPNWNNNTNWNIASTVDNRLGATVSNGHVIGLDIQENNLVGTMPAELGDLQWLQIFNLARNRLSGSIPPTFSMLANLKSFGVSNNLLSGTVPAVLATLSKIQDLGLNNNQFTGATPTQFTSSSTLSVFNINDNQPSGLIPNFSATPSLDRFTFENNEIQFGGGENEFVAYDSGISVFDDSPLAKIDVASTLNQNSGDNVTLTTLVPRGTQLHYTWYKGSTIVPGVPDSPNLTINNIQASDAGIYHCRITSDIVTDLTLYRNDITLSINAAPPEPSVTISPTSDEKCDIDTSMITLSAVVVPAVATGNYSYAWYEQGNSAILGTNTTYDVSPGTATTYVVVVTDDGLPLGSNSGNAVQTINVVRSPQLNQIENVTDCGTYQLPPITGTYLSGTARYYSGTNGSGTAYTPGTTIYFSNFATYPVTLYAYDEIVGNPLVCPSEISFTLTITGTPMPHSLRNVNECDSYTLPDLPPGTRYFDQMGAMGTEYFAGDIITSNITLYIYAGISGCSAETEFSITLDNAITAHKLDNVQSCNNYVLPEITNGRYFTQPMGQGIELFPFAVIDNTQTIYIYNESGACKVENEFVVTIDCTPPKPTTCVTFPNFFTPNLDGSNDFFRAYAEGSCTINGTISIYDRYGTLLKQFNAANDHWDGTYNGQNVPNTDYWYHYLDRETGAIVKGHFALKR